jgi:hypothetical protein
VNTELLAVELPPMTLVGIRRILEGVVPPSICSVSADGVPHENYLSHAEYVDPHHVALTFQLLNAEAVVWLVDSARTVTGELILLDSGMHLGGARGTVVATKNSGGRNDCFARTLSTTVSRIGRHLRCCRQQQRST